MTTDDLEDKKVSFPPPDRQDPDKVKTCPVCRNSDEVIPIVYGFPEKRLMKQANEGRVRLGGCVISNSDPCWYCKRDEIEF